MSLLTIESLRELNRSLSRKELIEKHYTKSQKKEIGRLDCLRVLFLFTTVIVVVIFVGMYILNMPSPSYRRFLIVSFLSVCLLFVIFAIFMGRSYRKMRDTYGMDLLRGVLYKEIVGHEINTLDEGLAKIRLYKFKEFCERESITLTKEHLFFFKERLDKDLKIDKYDNFSWTKQWGNMILPLFAASLFSVYLSKLGSINDIKIIFGVTFLLIYIVGFILFQINTSQNDKNIKRMNQYQDLLSVIEIAEFELIKDQLISLVDPDSIGF